MHELDAEGPEVAELRAANVRLQRQLASAKAKTAELSEQVYRAAKDAAVIVGRPAPKPATKDRRKRAGEVALVHATDWQCGKVSPSFSMQILEDRVGTFVEKVGKLTEIQRADHPVRECVVMLGGDMVEGVQIFPGQAWEIEATLYEQLFRCARIIEGMIAQIAGMFEHVRVVTEWGNHGRLGRRGDYPGGDNIDRMLYRIVEERVGGVEFTNSDDFYNRVVIGNYRAMLAHGDEIKSFGGNVPAFGILRKCNAWASGAIPFQFQDVYLGHFHTPMTLTLANAGRVFVTGSPESGNQYAQEFCAATGIPSQRLHFIDPERGRVSAEYLIWLDE